MPTFDIEVFRAKEEARLRAEERQRDKKYQTAVRRLLVKHNAQRKLRFEQLPVGARKAVEQYMNEGEPDSDWKKIRRFGYVVVPIREFTVFLMQYHTALHADHGMNFEGYHEWYIDDGMPTHSARNRWYSILNLKWADTVLEDGWHRFHRYYQLGCTTLPLVFYEPERWKRGTPRT